jgi:cyclase
VNRRRVIARLDIKGSNVIKGIQMEGLRVVGKPADFSRKYYEQGADELLYIDTVATLYGRENMQEIVQQAANEIFIPLTVGGGIRTVSDAKSMLMSGADKIAINSGAIRNPDLITDVARVFGNQCVVLSIEAKKVGPGKWEPYIDNGREPTGLDVVDWCRKAVDLGAGEVLVTSVDRDGTRRGMDIGLVVAVAEAVRVPVIASGGVGDTSHVAALFETTTADAVALAYALHYDKTTVGDVKSDLERRGIETRNPGP